MDDPAEWKPVTWGLMESPSEVTLELDRDAKQGSGALRVIGHQGSIYTMASRDVRADDSWNDYDGLAFWVKGDGSDNFACVRLRSRQWNNSWVGTFPLRNADWHEVKLAWGDMTATGSNPELGAKKGFMPGNLDNVAFGKSWNIDPQHKKPRVVLSLDNVRLVRGLKSGRRRVSIDKFPPVSEVLARMKAGQTVTILSLGDSITAEPGDRMSYPRQAAEKLRHHYGNGHITSVNAAIGGSTTAKARQWLKRDVDGLQADLVTIMFGYNEMPSSENIPGSTARWIGRMVTYLEEVAGVMEHPPACVILATIPGRDKNWEKLDPYAQAVRELVRDHPNLTVADVNAHFKAIGKAGYFGLMGDEAHPNDLGQSEMAEVVFEAILRADQTSMP